MEIQLCTRHRGEDTAGPWQPWPRHWGPNVHPCTRGISLDSRRSTSPANVSNRPTLLPSFLPSFLSLPCNSPLSFFFFCFLVSCFAQPPPFKPFILTVVINTIAFTVDALLLRLVSRFQRYNTLRWERKSRKRFSTNFQYGDTPLHTSARYGHAGVTRILISALCRVSDQNKVRFENLMDCINLKPSRVSRISPQIHLI